VTQINERINYAPSIGRVYYRLDDFHVTSRNLISSWIIDNRRHRFISESIAILVSRRPS